jgi:hypothetical protein
MIRQPAPYTAFRFTWLLAVCFALAQITAWAQNSNYGPLQCSMLTQEKLVKEGEVVTNVLVVKNRNGIAREFYLEIASPDDWQVLNSSNRIFNLEPDDSLFIPIRLVPNISGMKGGTKYNITVFVVGTDGRNHATCNFLVSKPRRTNWDMTVLPRSRIYFLNDQYRADLGIKLSNKGEDDQDVNLSWRIMGQGLSVFADSIGRKPFIDFTVGTDRDTVINFMADLQKPQRNLRRIDFESYRPQFVGDARKYTIYFSAVEPKSIKGKTSKTASATLTKLNSSVDFVKLSNTYTVNSYGSAVIPVTWFSNVFNILGVQPIWMNVFQIAAPLKENGMLRANLQHVFAFYSPSQNTLRNLNGNLSYNSKKLDILLGQGVRMRNPLLNGLQSILRPGTGIAATYRPWRSLFVSGSVSQSRGLFVDNPVARNYEASAGYTFLNKKLESSIGFSRTDLLQQNANVNSYMGGIRYRFYKNHRVLAAVGINQFTANLPTPTTDVNANWRFMYGGSFFDKRVSQAISYFRRNFISQTGALVNQNDFVRSQTRIALKKSRASFQFSAGYNRAIFNTALGQSQSIAVPLNLAFNVPTKRNYNVFPSFFYNYFETPLGRMQFRGANIGAAYFNAEKYIRANININAGYNRFYDSIAYRELFSARAFIGLQYRTFTFNTLYNYGPLGLNAVRNFHLNGARYPQYIFSSLSYQYVFKVTNFVAEMMLNHSWNNQTYSNNFSVSPQLFFFTRNGWRFNVQFFYNLNSRNNERAIEFYQYQGVTQISEPEERITYASNFNLSVGIRKTFGVPIPKKWRKTNYVNAQFRAFLDFNGNKIMDNDEVPLENVVIQVNGHEVLTDRDGKGVFNNIPEGMYSHRITPLVNLDGWFTYVKDSINIEGNEFNIPFTRGVMVQGNIVMDREKFTKDVLADLDLSGIKIFTTDTLGNSVATLTDRKGFFQFYVPYGAYVLSMDEQVLSDRFFIAQNHIPVDLVDGMDSYFQSFFIIEKRRIVKKKKFNENGEMVIVEEVAGGAQSRRTNEEDTDTKKPESLEGTIFRNERRSVPGDSLKGKDRYDELDERINRLDELIRLLLDGKDPKEADTKVLSDALRSLKTEEEAKRRNGSAKPDMTKINPERPFHVVVGGFVYRENAERFIEDMDKKGYKDLEIIGVFNGYYLVRLKDYPTRAAALEGQKQFTNVVKGAWIHKWP